MVTETRVHLTPLKDEHIDHYMSLTSDPDLVATMGWKPFGPDEKDRFIQFMQVLTLPNLDCGRSIVLSIISASDDKPVGYVSIKGIDEREACAEVGIAIMETAYRGQGYVTEALRQAVNYACHQLGLTRLGRNESE